MLKFTTYPQPDRTGRPTLWLCLSRRNLELLTEDKPIFVDGDEVDLDVNVAILSGETEAQLAQTLRGHGLNIPRLHVEDTP